MVMSLIESLTRIKNAVYGREVREGIHDGVFRANQIADGADTKADNTQIRQDAVEDFNNQMIQEMTDKDVISAPEIIESRDGEDKLSARLARDKSELKGRTLDLAVNAQLDFDISPTNISIGLQSAVDYATSMGYEKIIVPKGDYVALDPVYSSDGISIDFQGSTVRWNGDTALGLDHGRTRRIGFINFWGELGEEVDGFIDFIPEYRINNINRIWSDVSALTFDRDMTQELPVDSFVKLVLSTTKTGASDASAGYADGTGGYYPQSRIVARVVAHEGNNVVLGYKNPFDWSNAFFVEKSVKKIDKMVDTVKVEGLKFIDETPPFTGMPLNQDKQYWVSAVSLEYVTNFELDFIVAEGMKLPTVRIESCSKGVVDAVYASKPTAYGGGLAYGMQVLNSTYVNIYNFNADGQRHVIDFSGSAYCTVYGSGGNYDTNASFDLHGYCEHDITFDNCNGRLMFGNNWSLFPMLTDNIVIKGHRGVLMARYVNNLKVSDSFITLAADDESFLNNAEFHNVDITLATHDLSGNRPTFRPSSRGGRILRPKFKQVGGRMTLKPIYATEQFSPRFLSYDMVLHSDVDFVEETKSLNVFPTVTYEDVRVLDVKGGTIKDVILLHRFAKSAITKFVSIDTVFTKDLDAFGGRVGLLQVDLMPGIKSTDVCKLVVTDDTFTNISTSTLTPWGVRLRTASAGGIFPKYLIQVDGILLGSRVALDIPDLPEFIYNTFGNYSADGIVGILSKGILVTKSDGSYANLN